ncbi:hypothetical protein GOZ66_20265 [Vibrio parahaemolyticus]|nr:hypothetical protein [Vibrio parahaemolyticus]EGU6978761.1 hypothetical protein [Vibrio parahaemolyticus]PMT69982.1 hypothetical protein C1S93_17430 [Vibrio parahaemolyticus]HAS6756815.1 hypothetical protein [Vibrio parahaemolyticus]HAS6767192.1 hypothetical protein [Vibrio parahaemolyticus]
MNRFRPNRRTLPLSKLSQRFNDSLSYMNKKRAFMTLMSWQ